MKLKIHYSPFNSGGKGGQNNNRSFNAIEASVTLPDGEILKATSTLKSQHQNRKLARAILVKRVRDHLTPESERGETAGWGDPKRRVRTYHEPDNRVVDTSGIRASYSETVSKGDLSPLIDGRREALAMGADGE